MPMLRLCGTMPLFRENNEVFKGEVSVSPIDSAKVQKKEERGRIINDTQCKQLMDQGKVYTDNSIRAPCITLATFYNFEIVSKFKITQKCIYQR